METRAESAGKDAEGRALEDLRGRHVAGLAPHALRPKVRGGGFCITPASTG